MTWVVLESARALEKKSHDGSLFACEKTATCLCMKRRATTQRRPDGTQREDDGLLQKSRPIDSCGGVHDCDGPRCKSKLYGNSRQLLRLSC